MKWHTQHLFQRAAFGNHFSPPILLQQVMRSPGQPATDLTPLAFHREDRRLGAGMKKLAMEKPEELRGFMPK